MTPTIHQPYRRPFDHQGRATWDFPWLPAHGQVVNDTQDEYEWVASCAIVICPIIPTDKRTLVSVYSVDGGVDQELKGTGGFVLPNVQGIWSVVEPPSANAQLTGGQATSQFRVFARELWFPRRAKR